MQILAIIAELKKFMKEAVLDFSKKAKYVRERTKDFTRTRILPFHVLALMIPNTLKRSLSIEIQDFFTYVTGGASCTKQAFSRQRGKLKPDFFDSCNGVLLSGFYRHYGEHVKRWNGNLLLAVDGSTVPLPQTEALMQIFGGATNRSVSEPISERHVVCLLYDVPNRPVIKGKLHSYFSSEDDACMDSMDSMDFRDKVFLFDRGYPGFWLLYLLIQKDVKFVMRVRQSGNSTVKQFMESSEIE